MIRRLAQVSLVPSAAKVQDACHMGLCLAGWLLVTICCTGAAWLALFVVLGQFTFSGTLLHLDNFASRYLAADAARQAHLGDQFWIASTFLFLGLALLRAGSLPRWHPTCIPSPAQETSRG
jgi:lysylphosphatidylglycerol synthetase-like protein (DUF2156 family)